MILEENFLMSNGVEIPKLALGTWLIENDEAKTAVKNAIDLGYRHIDTAQAYGNEQGVGEGIKASGFSRYNIFVTSKVAAEIKDYNSAKQSIDKSLQRLGLDYIDLMLIHCPQPWSEYNKTDNRYKQENLEVWQAMEEAVKTGKIRSIGISNFLEEDTENILHNCSIKPIINQLRANPLDTPVKLIDYCRTQDILVEAYSPVAHGDALNNDMIRNLAKKYGVTAAQFCIGYVLQLGLVALPKTTNTEHMRNNAEIDFTISEDDMEMLLSRFR
ncbi:MAG: aldo/keto reductase [Oscillospiraceae bacterium]